MIRIETKKDQKKITQLEEDVLGPGRFARPSYRIREGHTHNIFYSHVYIRGSKIVASIRYFDCQNEGFKGLMLGPLIVNQKFKGNGIGTELINITIDKIKEQKINFLVLIGEHEYYKKFGFDINKEIYFKLNVRSEKVHSKILINSRKLSGLIEIG